MQLYSRLILVLFLLTFSITCTPKDEIPEKSTPDDVPTAHETTNSPDIQLTGEANEFNSLNPKLASNSDGVTYLVFQQCLFGDNCNKETIVATKQNADHTFSNPIEISPVGDGSANASSPSVAVDENGVAHIAWLDDGSAGARTQISDVLYRTWDYPPCCNSKLCS